MSALVVDVAVVSLNASGSEVERAFVILDARERAAASARAGDSRRRYVVAHAAARVVIGERLDVDPALVVIGVEAPGRPTVDGVAFSLAHSGERAAVALAPAGTRVGVDIEAVRPRPYVDRVARRIFDPDEYEAWRTRPRGERPRAFAQRWTKIEAVLKARGTGIAGGFASGRAIPDGWSCAAIAVDGGYVGAIAIDAAPVRVATRRLSSAQYL